MSKISSVYSTVLEHPPSCIEFWPADPNYFVVGTYRLEKVTGKSDDSRLQSPESNANVNDTMEGKSDVMHQERDGSIILFKLSDQVT